MMTLLSSAEWSHSHVVWEWGYVLKYQLFWLLQDGGPRNLEPACAASHKPVLQDLISQDLFELYIIVQQSGYIILQFIGFVIKKLFATLL